VNVLLGGRLIGTHIVWCHKMIAFGGQSRAKRRMCDLSKNHQFNWVAILVYEDVVVVAFVFFRDEIICSEGGSS